MKDINTYTPNEAYALVESMIDQDTKFNREVDALISTQEAKDILTNAYNSTDDAGKEALAQATEEQFLDKFAPAGKEEEKDGSENDDENQDDFITDGSIFDENDGSEDDTDDGSEDDNDGIDNSIFDDGGSEDDNTDNADNNEGNDNPFASASSGDDSNTAATPDNSSNPFFESRKPKNEHHLNEARKNARMIKIKKSKSILNETEENIDVFASEFDDDWCSDIYKFLSNRIKKFPSKREQYLYLMKIQKGGKTTDSVIQKFIVKNHVDVSKYGKDYLAAMRKVFSTLAGDVLDVEF